MSEPQPKQILEAVLFAAEEPVEEKLYPVVDSMIRAWHESRDAAVDDVMAAFGDARADPESSPLGVVIRGPAGSGKTHVLVNRVLRLLLGGELRPGHHVDVVVGQRRSDRIEEDARVPVGVTLDMHANLYDDIVRLSTVVTGYHTYPHVDTREAGERAAPSKTTMRIEFDPTSTTPTRDKARFGRVANILPKGSTFLPVVVRTPFIEASPAWPHRKC